MPGHPVMVDCWNKIGVRGDGSCPELETHVHCRNCPVHAAAAGLLLTAAPPSGYLEEWTGHVAKVRVVEPPDFETALVFRIGTELLALATGIIDEVADWKPIHSIPHRRDGAVLGIVNVRGELLVCASLAFLLKVEKGSSARVDDPGRRRLLVLRRESVRAVCPVDDVVGVQRFVASDLSDVPATVARSTLRYTRKILSWQGRPIGLLDDQLVIYALKRGLA